MKKSKCSTCGYRWRKDRTGEYRCQYILIEKKRRPCKAGENCTAYKKSLVPFELDAYD